MCNVEAVDASAMSGAPHMLQSEPGVDGMWYVFRLVSRLEMRLMVSVHAGGMMTGAFWMLEGRTDLWWGKKKELRIDHWAVVGPGNE